MTRIGCPRTCECGTCEKCLHREYQRAWYRSKTLDERRAMIAGRNPETVRRAEQRRYAGRKGTPMYVCNYTSNNAVRDGVLTPQPCEFCGTTERVHKHHTDYSKPLEVVWLCEAHHMRLHELIAGASL